MRNQMNSCSFEIRLKPRAKKDTVSVVSPGKLEVSVTSPPLENKANEHLVKLLADKLDIPKRSLRFLKGEHSRNKAIAVDGLTMEESLRRLQL
jgi:uncharacterized protein (TIGR00251 family)